MLIVFCYLFFQAYFALFGSVPLKECLPKQTINEHRKLYVATCDSRSGFYEFQALRVWNITGNSLRNQGVVMSNVCKGTNWGRLGFLTKPMKYVEYIRNILSNKNDDDVKDIYIIIMDSDTFWSVTELNKVWTNFDCARGNKEVVVSTETQCWIGRYCWKEDIEKYYSNSSISTSSSIFLNSGVIMGRADKVLKMLKHVIEHNQSYYITNVKHKFDDQLAIGHYSLKIASEDIALDYHQQIAAGFSLYRPRNPPKGIGPFVCKADNQSISYDCEDGTRIIRSRQLIALNTTDCRVHRRECGKRDCKAVLEDLVLNPLIWHGNGIGKRMYYYWDGLTFQCHLRQRNISTDEFMKQQYI